MDGDLSKLLTSLIVHCAVDINIKTSISEFKWAESLEDLRLSIYFESRNWSANNIWQILYKSGDFEMLIEHDAFPGILFKFCSYFDRLAAM